MFKFLIILNIVYFQFFVDTHGYPNRFSLKVMENSKELTI